MSNIGTVHKFHQHLPDFTAAKASIRHK